MGEFMHIHTTLNHDFSSSLTSFEEDCFNCMPNLMRSSCKYNIIAVFFFYLAFILFESSINILHNEKQSCIFHSKTNIERQFYGICGNSDCWAFYSYVVQSLGIGLEISRIELVWARFDSLRIDSARNSTLVRTECFFKLKLGSFNIRKRLGSAR